MTANPLRLLALLACLFAQPLFVQAQADSAAFEQGRLRIWCETTRFVYEDNQADSLLPSLNCQSWESLRAAMARTDGSLGVLRLMNSVDKPAIYQGYANSEAKLQKLVVEISNRLRQSPVRRNNAARLQGVDSLQQQLVLLVRQTDPAPAEADEQALPGQDLEVADEGNETIYPPVRQLETNQAANAPLPWNELLQWLLLLVLTGLALWRFREYEARHARMKREFRTLEMQVNEFMIANLQAPSAAPPAKKSLTEQEVRRLVKEELKQASPAPKPVAAPQPPSQQPLAQPAIPSQPAAEAAPASVPPVAVAAATTPAAETASGLYYDKMPFRGGFHQHELSRERQRDSLYTLNLGREQQGEADYWVTEDPEIQRYAMQNGMSFFEEGCEFAEVEENPSRVVNEQKGRLRKEGSVWKIIQKARVRFE